MRLLVVVSVSMSLALFGCGKDDKGDKGGGGGDNAPKPAAGGGGGDGPAVDCAAWETKMNECIDAFAPLYAKTDMGSKAGKDMDGNVDHEKAAKRFKTLWGLEGVKLCTGPAQMITPYSKRDARWKERFNGCDASAACDAWAPCMATAMGEPL